MKIRLTRVAAEPPHLLDKADAKDGGPLNLFVG